jgi:hypothetical protein
MNSVSFAIHSQVDYFLSLNNKIVRTLIYRVALRSSPVLYVNINWLL